jgi:WD40 repeat protein
MASLMASCVQNTVKAEIIARKETEWKAPDGSEILGRYADVALPCRPERNHLAYASSDCLLADGKRLVGTKDSMLALVDQEGNVFSLGAVGPCGPIHALSASPDGMSAIGVSGDENDLGVVFRFDVKTGLKIYGRIFFHDANVRGLIGASNEPRFVSWSPDGKSVAIGVHDRLACVYRFVLP